MPSDDLITAEQPTPRGRTHRRGRARRRTVTVALAVLTGSACAGTLTLSASAAPTVAITVDAGTSLGTVPATGVGLNTAVYDPNLNDATASSLMKAAGIRQLRYPGGSVADNYHWKTHSLTGGGSWTAPGTDFDHFMATAKTVGAQPIITANYGSGSPQEAADWVKYANVDKGYGIKYWEIGNEVYGNGHYQNGNGWEYDTHADKSPKEYATNLVAYAKAMKAVDPTVKIGAVLATPGGYPDGFTASGDSADFNHTVLSIAGPSIDFVIVHWSPRSPPAAPSRSAAPPGTARRRTRTDPPDRRRRSATRPGRSPPAACPPAGPWCSSPPNPARAANGPSGPVTRPPCWAWRTAAASSHCPATCTTTVTPRSPSGSTRPSSRRPSAAGPASDGG
ncbi:hypothetical protein [Kitasatospora sp. NPDC056531]|uniref:hypothetical protein n=1 Tax=Kitasatospora sp. NPDC056531 TaxID=3345856 RepID=UPI003695169A